jgi:DNA-binding response OmpR family regulator
MDAPKRILIVDDEPNVRLVFRTALETTGYLVTEAADGDAALEQLRKLPIDLILLDLKMPVVDGMETLRRLRDAGDKTPVVVITAHGSVPDAVAVMKLGAVDFLPKPVSPATLRAVVSGVCALFTVNREPVKTAILTAAAPTYLFEEDLSRTRQAMERREYDDAEFFLRIADALNPGSQEVVRLRETLHSRKIHPEGFSFRSLGDMLR